MRKTHARYGEKETSHAGFTFHSKLEAAVYDLLKIREKAGELFVVQNQDVVYLSKARIRYEPDFKCVDTKTGENFWVEAKGYANDRWPTVKKLWKHYGPGKLEIWRGSYIKPFLDQEIIPSFEGEE